MAWLEKRETNYQIALRHNGLRLRRSLQTDDEGEANDLLSRVERRSRLVDQGDIVLPDDVDLLAYALSDGRHTQQPQRRSPITIEELHQRYLADLPQESLEENSLKTISTHVKHLQRLLGERFDVVRLSHADLQRYVNLRSIEKGRRGKPISSVTIHVILDNYCIHCTRQVDISLDSEQGRRLRLHFLPPYCPDHNRIERTWRDLHAQVTRNHTCPDMNSLMRNVRHHLKHHNRKLQTPQSAA